MSFVGSNILAGASGQGGGYKERSIRFNASDSSYLSRTPSSAGNRKTWTWSAWLKRSGIGANDNLFKVAGSSSKATQFSIMIHNGDYVSIDYGGAFYLRSTRLLRDPSAWQHWVVSVDTTNSTANNRIRLYINKVEETAFDTRNNPDQNEDLGINRASEHTISSNDSSGLDGYLADVHFIDGQALAPTDFGETDTNGVWQPKEYSGTYGTNGFHLDFKDNSSNAALGTDTSGNSNTWTVNNLSVAAGAGNDSLRDSPSQIADQTDSGAGGEVVGNYATLNPLQKSSGSTLTNGNLDISMSGAQGTTFATMAFPAAGKWYFECTANSSQGDVGIAKAGADLSQYVGKNSSSYGYYIDGNVYHNDSSAGSGASYGSGDIIGVAFDSDAGTCKWYKNNSLQVTISSLTGEWFPAFGAGNAAGIFNFGQRAFAYTAPSGYKSLNTANLDPPTIADGSKYFDTKLYTGNNGTTSVNYEFSPDFVWIKGRSEVLTHRLVDIVRGDKQLNSNSNVAESDFTALDFESDGFDITNDANEQNKSGTTYAAWAWDGGTAFSNSAGSNGATIASSGVATPSAGFSICTYTGNDTGGATIRHGLNAAVEFLIVKDRGALASWHCQHSAIGNTSAIFLNSTTAATPNGAYWNNTSPTSSVFTVGTSDGMNGLNNNYVAYCFAPVAGYSAIGSFNPNGTTDNAFVYTGFRPRFILARFTSAGDWMMLDTSRRPNGPTGGTLVANVANSEDGYYGSGQVGIDFLSNGFKIRHSGSPLGDSGKTVIYYCVAENPFKYSRAY